MDTAPGRQVALPPTPAGGLPAAPQPGDHRRRQVRGVLAGESSGRLLEVAGRDAAQVQDRQQCLQARRPPCPARQDPGGEANPLLAPGRSAVADLHPPHLDRTGPGLDGPLGTMTVPNGPGPAIGEPLVGHPGQEGLGFRLDRLGKQAACARAQHRGQRISSISSGCGKRTTVPASFMAYRSAWRFCQAGHPPRYATFLRPSSPSPRHSPVRERVEHLFGPYERMAVPLMAPPRRPARARRAPQPVT